MRPGSLTFPASVWFLAALAVPVFSGSPVRLSGPEIPSSASTHDGQVVWSGWDGQDEEIFLYDGSQVRQLTNNERPDGMPLIHNGQVVWVSFDGYDDEIMFFDGSRILQLSDNEHQDLFPSLNAGQVAWQGRDAFDSQIFLYNGVRIRNLTNLTSGAVSSPVTHNGQVAWTGNSSNSYDIFFKDSDSTRRLGDEYFQDSSASLHNGQLAWTTNYPESQEISFFDGAQTYRLTNDSIWDFSPLINSGMVAWKSYEEGLTTLKIYEGGRIRTLGPLLRGFSIDNGQVVWDALQDGDSEIFLYEKGQIRQLTNNAQEDGYPSIQNRRVAWIGTDDQLAAHVYMMDLRSAGLSIEGEQQRIGNVREELAESLVVKASSGMGGVPLSDMRVEFSVTASSAPKDAVGYSVSPSTAVTGQDGLVQTIFTIGDIPAEYQVTATCLDCATGKSTVTFNCCGKLKNDNFKQSSATWKNDPYDTICYQSNDVTRKPFNCKTPPSSSVSISSFTVGQKGCSLSVMATLINFYARTFPDLALKITTPGELNVKLRELGQNGYSVEGDVLFPNINYATDNKIVYGGRTDLSASATSAQRQAMLALTADRDLSSKDPVPVVFRVYRSKMINGQTSVWTHYLLAVGKCEGKYIVSDPSSSLIPGLFDPNEIRVINSATQEKVGPLLGIRRFTK
jgi:hypothetical protein